MGIKTTLICDECGKEIVLDGPYHVAKAAMKEAGWRNVKVGEEWQIKCDEHGGSHGN
jgi:hypothetical protein